MLGDLPVQKDDIFAPRMELYLGASLLYSIRPPLELQIAMGEVASRVGATSDPTSAGRGGRAARIWEKAGRCGGSQVLSVQRKTKDCVGCLSLDGQSRQSARLKELSNSACRDLLSMPNWSELLQVGIA